MDHPLYSQLRTIYETTVENPHTFRLTLKLRDMIDGALLRQAVDRTMTRYPYFRVRLRRAGEGFVFSDNDAPLAVVNQDDPLLLASPASNHHLMGFCWWKNKIHLDVYHGLTDGGGIYQFIRTLLYYYCTRFYGVELSAEGVRLAEDPVDPREWEDPGRWPLEDEPALVRKWESPAFQLKDGGIAQLSPHAIVYNIRIPETEFMRFNLSNDGSPGTVISLFLARALEDLHPEQRLPTVIAMCVNQRPMLGAPLAHQSLVGDVRLVYGEQLRPLAFDRQATCFRGMVALQSDRSMVRREVREYQQLMARLDALPDRAARHRLCLERMDRLTACFTATVSYVGKAGLGDAEEFIQEFHVVPSTALPSSATPLTLELSAINGSFYVNFIQYFSQQDYLDAFLRQLREHRIRYDVLYEESAKFPGMPDLWYE